MLVLERGPQESVFLEVPGLGRIVVEVVRFRSGRVRLGISAPAAVKILRSVGAARGERRCRMTAARCLSEAGRFHDVTLDSLKAAAAELAKAAELNSQALIIGAQGDAAIGDLIQSARDRLDEGIVHLAQYAQCVRNAAEALRPHATVLEPCGAWVKYSCDAERDYYRCEGCGTQTTRPMGQPHPVQHHRPKVTLRSGDAVDASRPPVTGEPRGVPIA